MFLWGKDGDALLHFIHFTFAIGAMLTPLYTEPFIVSKDEAFDIHLNTTNELSIHKSGNISKYRFLEGTYSHSISNVHYAFLITGCISFLVSIVFIILYFIDKTPIKPSSDTLGITKSRDLPFSLQVLIVSIIVFLFLVYSCVEDTFASFLMTFVVKEFDFVSKSEGAYITTVFWALFAVGRFFSIFIVKYFNPARLITLCLFVMTSSLVLFTVSVFLAEVTAMTVFAGLEGLGMAAMFPAIMLWTETELVKLTSWVSSFICIGSAFGMMMNPVIVAYLMEEVANIWFCYLLLAQAMLTFISFLLLLSFNRCYINHKYGKIQQTVTDTDGVSL